MKTISVFTKSGVTVTFKENEKFTLMDEYIGVKTTLDINELYIHLTNCKSMFSAVHIKQEFTYEKETITHLVYMPSDQISWIIMEEKQ